MMLAPACKTCPWRIDGFDYDEDGREAFIEGYEPSCHLLVGLQSVFHHQPARQGEACRGPDHFYAGEPGHRDPITPTAQAG